MYLDIHVNNLPIVHVRKAVKNLAKESCNVGLQRHLILVKDGLEISSWRAEKGK
jgi:hypothetical protein